MRLIPLSQGCSTVVDDADYAWLNQWKWYYQKGHAVRKVKLENGKWIRFWMHRVIAKTPAGFETDHRDGDGLNNRRYNLRTATHSQNNHNRGKYATNTTGYKGVSFDKRDKIYRAFIMLNGTNTCLGRFGVPEEAATVYCQAAEKLHGEFARTL